MSKQKVTVIIPTYKRAEFLNRAIDSVLSQTYKNIEIIVVDDNEDESHDRKKTEGLMEKYKNNNKVKYIKHHKNLNGAAARNTGLKEATGEYVTFLDDDDFYLKHRIETLVYELERNKEFNAAYTGVIRISNKKIVGIYEANVEGNLQEMILKLYSFFRTGSNMFFRMSAIEELNGFDVEFLRHQDIEYMARFFKKNKIKAVRNFSVIKDDSSRINSPNIEKSLEMKELFIKKFNKDINEQKNKKEILQTIYQQIYNICPKNNSKKEYIKNKILEYGKINRKEEIITTLKLKFPKIKIKLEQIKSRIKRKKISKKELKELYEYIG